MNTSSKKDKQDDPWKEVFSFANEGEEIRHNAQMLMFAFLGKVAEYQELRGINKKMLAEKIKTSPSYITQLFRGSKPLNFETISKMEKALGIRFQVHAVTDDRMVLPLHADTIKRKITINKKTVPRRTANSTN